MSRAKPDEMQTLGLELECTRCGAQPHAWCTTSKGGVARYLHDDRTWLLWRAYQRGRRLGEISALDCAAGLLTDAFMGRPVPARVPRVRSDVVAVWLRERAEGVASL